MRNLCENCGCEVPRPIDGFKADESGDIRIVCKDCREGRKKQFIFFGLEVIESTPKASGNGAVTYVPKKWLGCRVAVVKLE